MYEWILAEHQWGGWELRTNSGGAGCVRPVYRGAFETDAAAPDSIVMTFRPPGAGGASARFRAPGFLKAPRPFGVSVTVDPGLWRPSGIRRGWHCFSNQDFVMALHSSLPAAWLAQDADGTPLTPPWRELWTFGSDHVWTIRLGCPAREGSAAGKGFDTDRADGITGGADMESFIASLPESPGRPPRRGGTLFTGDTLLRGDRS